MIRNACQASPLESWTTTRRACFRGVVLVRNVVGEPNREKSGDKDEWAALCCWGNFTGGDLVIPALKQRFDFRPGDVVILRSALLEHYVLPFEGERSSIMFFGSGCGMGGFEPES